MREIIVMKNPMSTRLALFDLDNTLLAGDSDHAWGEFLITKKLVDEASHRKTNDEYYNDYRAGKLDVHAYVRFTITPILSLSPEERSDLHREFMDTFIQPMILDKAQKLINSHKQAGDYCIIITATNEYVTGPIAKIFNVHHLLATELEIDCGQFTGEILGIPCFREGKFERLKLWISSQTESYDLTASMFYSDSINDLPLLEKVTQAIAVDPDESLRQIAQTRNWEIISLR
jgi:HAD superfamily hydrolase (TIGR01490 family)